MGTIHQFPSGRAATNVQLSAYPQDDGSQLYCIEVLFDDDTRDRTGLTRSLAEGWLLAGKEAIDRRVPLLPTSTFPGRAA